MGPRGPADAAFVDSSAALASLYQAPLSEFVSRRAALVSQLKKSGHKDVAARLATAPKPSRAAYLLNQVYWRARAVYDDVLEAGSAARAAQQARLLGDEGHDLAATLQARDIAVAAAHAEAERIAVDEGLGASDSIAAQVRASFEALAAHGREGRLAHGHLVSDVELPGLAALAGLVLPASSPPPRQFQVVARRAEPAPAEPPPDPRREAAARRAADAQARERAATDRAAELQRTLESVRAQVTDAEAAVADATRRLGEARRHLEKGEAAYESVRQDLEQASHARALADAELAALTPRTAGGDEPPTGPPDGTRVKKRLRPPAKRSR